ncbi:hypothetical protein, partial [Nocardia gipuzkoensis]|uniref:hypothetical protein n=1 Tax=Nocardia gipuzkoensis TaxID=2749991 RepID=UPI002453B54A
VILIFIGPPGGGAGGGAGGAGRAGPPRRRPPRAPPPPPPPPRGPAEPYRYWPVFDSVSMARLALAFLPVTSVRM